MALINEHALEQNSANIMCTSILLCVPYVANKTYSLVFIDNKGEYPLHATRL